VKQHPFSLAAKLQLVLTEGIEHTQYQQRYDSCGAYQQAIQRALSENDNCSAWLTVLPTEPAYRLRDDQFRLAVRHRLGMLPYDDLRDDYCLTCRRRNSSIPHFLADPDHLHACVKQTGVMMSLRHDRIVATLATLARSVGFAVKREPSFEHRTRLCTRVDEETGEEHDELVTDRSRGDLLLVRHNTRLVVDVTVTRPTAKTVLRLRRGVPLAAAAAAEKRKHNSYDDACDRDGATMVPFAVESYGAMGKQAQKLLLKLADALEELSAEAFLRHASAVVSVALQCAEGQLGARGCLHLRQKLRVAHCKGCAIAVADGPCNVTTDLCCTECTCSACAWFALQRGRSGIPPLMPALHCSLSSSDRMSVRECSEGVSGVTWSVLEEDVMLGFGTEMLHCCVE
jgi:hypothetical protein